MATGEARRICEGARVAVNPLIGCGECRLCRAGDTNLCADRVLVGVHVPGAFADFVKVRAVDARRLPDGVSTRVGALMEPLANGVHAVRLAPEGVERTVVIGAGTIGLVTLQAALLDGLPNVAVVEPRTSARRASGAGRSAATRRRGGQGRGRGRPRDRRGRRARRRGSSAWSCCGPAGRWSASASRTTTRRSASTTSSAASTASRAPTRTRCPTSSRPTSGSSAAQATLGDDLTAVRPLEDGPEAFARLAGGPPPPEFKLFLAGEGREA